MMRSAKLNCSLEQLSTNNKSFEAANEMGPKKMKKCIGYPFIRQTEPITLPRGYSAIMHHVPGNVTVIRPPRYAASAFKPRSVYEVYPAPANYQSGPPPRVDPYNFSRTKPKSCVLETSDMHNYMHGRALRMLQTEYLRYHTNWKAYYYGNPVEKERYGSYIRQGLKQQISDKDKRKQEEMEQKSRETEEIEAHCRKYDESIHSAARKKRESLFQFRDANKQMIADREQSRKLERQKTISLEREQLTYNPINWSCTLK